MVNKQGQINLIKSILREKGQISRNWALNNRIGRLASRMTDLKNDGWEFETKKIGQDLKNGIQGDFIYKLSKTPYIPKLVYSPEKNAMIYDNQQKLC